MRRVGHTRSQLLLLSVAHFAAEFPARAGSEAMVTYHGDTITVGSFLNCFSPALGLTVEACCGDEVSGSACWDDVYTRERCCDMSHALVRAGCLKDVRAQLSMCTDTDCNASVAGTVICDALVETPACAVRCGLPRQDFYGFGTARSNSLGRLLNCLAQRPEVNIVVDMFIHDGRGSTPTLADSLALRSNAGSTVLIGFEREHAEFARAEASLKERPGLEVSTFRLTGSESAEELDDLARRAATAARLRQNSGKVSVLLFKGEPYPDGGAPPYKRLYAQPRPSILQALCKELPVDMLYLDGYASDAEFTTLEEACPLKWVVLNNVNLPGVDGWIREHLLTMPSWAEVLTGRTVDRWAAGALEHGQVSSGIPRVYTVRAWSALAKVNALCQEAPNASTDEAPSRTDDALPSARKPAANDAERVALQPTPDADAAYVLEMARFRSIRRNSWAGLGLSKEMPRELMESGAHLPADVKWQMASSGQGHFNGILVPKPSKATEGTEVKQVGGGRRVAHLLRFQGTRPIWDAHLVRALQKLQSEGRSVSPPLYPHGAEDIALAWKSFVHDGKNRAHAVWSSVSPWIEVTLLAFGLSSVTTVDYNAPLVRDVPVLRTLDQAALADAYARGEASFDVVVSFSGLEHDGLGRYGDPINPDGDLAAMREIRACMRPGGVLLLAVPVGAVDNVVYPYHRVYGPVRLPLLLEGYELLGRVWNGTVVRGGLEHARQPPVLWCAGRSQGPGGCGVKDWQHQPVLVLRRRD
eukprot:TRINITY_DN18862_c0_g1_i2.p1 TRINITY_DN18862_c0_g1~~TRINITY_DN18862_c0_g1_i2.p1  ORF type:complete len:756 (-),score=90.31 TRINITY_DN18862_c0_g1_i2:108-2375(-)